MTKERKSLSQKSRQNFRRRSEDGLPVGKKNTEKQKKNDKRWKNSIIKNQDKIFASPDPVTYNPE